MLGAVLIAVVAGWAGWSLGRKSVGVVQSVRVGRPDVSEGIKGPWGRLEYDPIVIEPPSDHLDPLSPRTPEWFFGGHSRLQVENLLKTSGFSAFAVGEISRNGQWQVTPQGTSVNPPPDVVLDMASSTRQTIYGVLGQSIENPVQFRPFAFEASELESLFLASGLNQQTVDGFKRLLYPYGSKVAFSDTWMFQRWLPQDKALARFVGMLLRSPTFLVRLKVGAQDDVGGLVRYWDRRGSAEDLRPLLLALARQPAGDAINIAYLLPPFARQRLYRFPRLSDASADKMDCFWTALNFFNSTPDDRFHDPDFVLKTLATDYRPVQDLQFGDLVVLLNGKAIPLHAAVHLADDLVFTKNGITPSAPWLLTKRQGMVELYDSIYKEPLRPVYLRHK